MKKEQVYAYVVNDVIAKIKKGILLPGEKLPTEKELCDLYGVSHSSIKKAMGILINLGYVSSIQRVGNYVNAKKTSEYILKFDPIHFVKDLNLVKSAVKYEGIVCKAENRITWTMNGLSEKLSAMEFSSTYNANNTVIMTEETFVFLHENTKSNDRCISREKAEKLILSAERFSEVSKARIQLTKAEETVAQQLKIKEHAPIFCIERYGLDRYNKVIFYTKTYCKMEHITMSARSKKLKPLV